MHAQILPQPVQVTGADFDGEGQISPEIRQRIENLADAVFEAACARVRGLALQAGKARI